MSTSSTTTCDACGKEKPGMPFSWTAHADGWLTVSYTGQIVSGLMPYEYAAKHPNPDLCSWSCVARYAAAKVGGEARRELDRADRVAGG